MAYVILNAKVVRTFFEGKGATLVEEFEKRDGTTGSAYFTAFFTAPHGLDEGDSGVFKGNLSVTLDSYDKDGETKYSAKATLNNTKAEEIVAAEASTPQEPAKVGF